MSLSTLMLAMTSCTVFFISASGAITSACTTPTAKHINTPETILLNAIMSSFILFNRFFSLVIDELADQVFQHHRRLRLFDLLPVFEHLAVAAGHQAYVLFAKQTRSQNICERILGKLITFVQTHHDLGFVAFRIQGDVGDAPDQHPGALDRCFGLQPPDIGTLTSKHLTL